jgi:hypothetical protein
MAGLVPAIHVLFCADHKDVDARDKPGHDERKKAPAKPGPLMSGKMPADQRE